MSEPVPYERFKEVIDAKKELEARLAAAESAAAEATKRASTVDELTAQLASLQATMSAKEKEFAKNTAFIQAGITDPSIQEVFGYYLDKAGPDVVPSEWLAKLQADPSTAPAALSRLMSQPQVSAPPVAAAPPPQAAPSPTAPPVPSNEGARPPPTNSIAYTADEINRMSASEFIRNYSAIKQANPKLNLPDNLPGSIKPA